MNTSAQIVSKALATAVAVVLFEMTAAVAQAQSIVTQIAIPTTSQYYVDVNTGSNMVFVSGGASSGETITMINGNTNTIVGGIGTGSGAHVNSVTNRLYAGSVFGGTVLVYDATSGASITGIPMPGCPIYAAVDPSNNRVYGGAQCNDTVSTMDGASNTLIRSTAAGGVFSYIVANSNTHLIYEVASGVTKKIDPNTGALSSVTFPGTIQAANPALNILYSQSGANTVLVNGNTEATIRSVPVAGQVAANSAKNHFYVADSVSLSVKIYNGTGTLLLGQVSLGGQSLGSIASNTITGNVYVIGYTAAGPVLYVFNDSLPTSPAAVTALGAVSRKVHGGAGSFDVDLPLTGTAGLECRSGGATNDHQIVVTFGSSVTFNSAAMTSGTGSVSGTSGSGSTQPVINLTGVTNAQALAVTLFGVNDGTNITDIQVPMRVLLGDTTGNGTVNSSDVGQVKGTSGQTTGASNFRTDLTVSGEINSSDIGVVKSQSGTVLP